MHAPGEIINIPAKVLHVLTDAGGKKTLILQRVPQADLVPGGTGGGGAAADDEGFAVMWGS